jgi:FlaA1/EpsC-like NDP-sugar epimerase
LRQTALISWERGRPLTRLEYHKHRWRKSAFAALLDATIVVLAYYLILAFRFDGAIPRGMRLGSLDLMVFLCVAIVLHVCLNAAFRVYSIVNRYVGLSQALWVVQAALVSVCVLLLVDLAWSRGHARPMPLSVVLVGGAIAAAAMIAVRFYSRVFHTLSLSPVSRQDGARSGRRLRGRDVGAADPQHPGGRSQDSGAA